MKIGVSPAFAKDFPDLIPAKENPTTFFRCTFCHVSERDEYWVQSRNRRLRPFFCADPKDVQEVLDLLQQKQA